MAAGAGTSVYGLAAPLWARLYELMLSRQDPPRTPVLERADQRLTGLGPTPAPARSAGLPGNGSRRRRPAHGSGGESDSEAEGDQRLLQGG
jgi:hypothetical protein